jgi:hypothetical protein
VRSFISVLILLGGLYLPVQAAAGPWMDSSMGLLQGELTARFGPGQRLRIQRGLAQAARFWRPGDGGAGEFEAFVRTHFAGDPKALDDLFRRLEGLLTSLDRHLRAMGREFQRDPEGAALPIDPILAGYDPGAHLAEDFFTHKLAFAVLLNFPLTTLEERVRDGGAWTGRQWAEAWLADRFSRRVPAEVNQAEAEAAAARRGLAQGAGPEVRCQVLLGSFQAARKLDPYSPLAPTRMARSFTQERQLPEARVRAMLEAVCGSPLAARTAALIRARLDRPLRPSDLWYDGFHPGAGSRQAELDALVRKRRAAELELVRDRQESPFLAGVPGPAFAGALERLGQPGPGNKALEALDAFWSTFAGAGAALVDMAVWHWLYEHPDASPASLKPAVAAIAAGIWNRTYAPLLGQPDCALLADNSLLFAGRLDLPDLPIARLIGFQIRRKQGPAGTFERCARLGRLTPDLWMTRATGSPLGPEVLLEATAEALAELGH